MNFISIVVLSLVHVCWVMNDEQCVVYVLCTVLNIIVSLSRVSQKMIVHSYFFSGMFVQSNFPHYRSRS